MFEVNTQASCVYTENFVPDNRKRSLYGIQGLVHV